MRELSAWLLGLGERRGPKITQGPQITQRRKCLGSRTESAQLPAPRLVLSCSPSAPKSESLPWSSCTTLHKIPPKHCFCSIRTFKLDVAFFTSPAWYFSMVFTPWKGEKLPPGVQRRSREELWGLSSCPDHRPAAPTPQLQPGQLPSHPWPRQREHLPSLGNSLRSFSTLHSSPI